MIPSFSTYALMTIRKLRDQVYSLIKHSIGKGKKTGLRFHNVHLIAYIASFY